MPARQKSPITERSKERGVAAVEFALSLFLLVPLLLGLLDYGYYFYVAVNVVEAQRAGLVAASRAAVGDCSSSASSSAITAKTAAQTAAAAAVTSYLTANGLNTALALTGSTPACAGTPLNPTWTMSLIADFKPASGRVWPWIKASPTSGKVRYTARTLAMRGK